jgi:hypothetical protein
MKMWIKANQNQSGLIRTLLDEARHLIKQGYHERAAQILQKCLQLEPKSKMRASILEARKPPGQR